MEIIRKEDKVPFSKDHYTNMLKERTDIFEEAKLFKNKLDE